ncbi:hypothetical protein [Embleya sp. NPDC005971]|uniref:hypothetical protein n=1 Tax=Embleya sp. NPDC005971 TaxID=3156724 RepID=UPI0034061163
MTADRHSIAAPPTGRPEWVPREYSQLVRIGEHFDVVRIAGLRGLDVANAVRAVAGGTPGAIVHELYGREWVHILVPPGTTASLRWPPGIQALGSDASRERCIEIPALDDDSCLLAWHSRPTESTPLVDTALCHTVLVYELADVLDPSDWTDRPDPRG